MYKKLVSLLLVCAIVTGCLTVGDLSPKFSYANTIGEESVATSSNAKRNKDKDDEVLDEKKAKVDAVKRWINSIDDGQTRCVFRMFYMDGMSWLQIADKLKCTGDHREDYPRICIRDYYLKKMGIA